MLSQALHSTLDRSSVKVKFCQGFELAIRDRVTPNRNGPPHFFGYGDGPLVQPFRLCPRVPIGRSSGANTAASASELPVELAATQAVQRLILEVVFVMDIDDTIFGHVVPPKLLAG